MPKSMYVQKLITILFSRSGYKHLFRPYITLVFSVSNIPLGLCFRLGVFTEFKAIIRGFRFTETNFPEEIYTLPSDSPHMNGIEAVWLC